MVVKFAEINLETLRDKNISLGAKGMLLVLDVCEGHLDKVPLFLKEMSYEVNSMLQELVDAKYITFEDPEREWRIRDD